ncbi:alpha/beta fold hydrolase [Actinomadura syzygii]|uniref:Alpha/beta hydrolase n=1 Tax=Actinomadura syzygii TaxID=1427538 RepID=A0A5D0UDT0_9ACTN|nr:alpha/beta hydrolase [Actinomadura syzygii]TYC15936.1 alpha/beta hydrolase [Actinomadura syzygii]
MPYLDVDGTRLYYEHFDTGRPPLALVHGAGQDTLSWQYVSDRLTDHFSVIALDLPGHGKSARRPGGAAIADYADHIPYVDGLMAALGHRRYVFMGHSFAGGLGLSLARARPDSVAAVIMLDGTGCPSAAWGGDAFDLVAINPTDWMEVNFRLICGPATNPARVDEISRDVLRCPPDVVQGDIKAFARTDLQGDLPTMTTPVLAIHGLDDWSIPPELGRRTCEQIGGPAVFHGLADVGHFPHVEAPDRLMDAVDELWPGFAADHLELSMTEESTR